MVKFLKSSKDVNAILVEKTDRLYRNPSDYGLIDESQFEIHFVKEHEILDENASSHQKFVHGLKVLIAKNFIDNLREETRKGLKEKAEEGIFPNRAPYGYKNVRNDRGKSVIEVDETRTLFVKRAFEIYSKGDISIKDTASQLYNEGIFYRTYSPRITPGALEDMLKNPFYTGVFRFRGEIMQGTHVPIISKILFERVQRAFKKDGKPLYRKHQFLLGNFITCGDCGCSVVGEIKKQKYVYYRCTWAHGKDKCNNLKYYSEKFLLEQLADAVKAVEIDEELKKEIINAVIQLNKQEQNFQQDNLQRLNLEAEKIRQEIRAVYQDKLDGVLSTEQWQEENEFRQQKLSMIKTKMEAFDNTNQRFMDDINYTLELLNGLYDVYLQISDEQKVDLLKTLLSNCVLKGGKLSWAYKKPFCYLVERADFKNIYPGCDSNA